MILPLFLALATAAPAADLTSAYADIRGKAPVVSMMDVGACYTRPDDARADGLGLPKRFCLTKVGTREPADALTPFDIQGSALIEGTPVVGASHHILGGGKRANGWDVAVDLYQGEGAPAKCGTLSAAFAAVYFSVDAVGKPLAMPVTVRGFLIDQSPACRTRAQSVTLDYVRQP